MYLADCILPDGSKTHHENTIKCTFTMFGEMVLILSLPIDEKPATKFTSVTPGS